MKVQIGEKMVGEREPCLVIAEIGINHNGDIKVAKELIDSAKKSGADIVKFQSFTAEGLLSKNIVVPSHIKSSASFFEMVRAWELSEDDHQELFEYCKQKGIIFLSTPVNEKFVDLLDEIGVFAFKVASSDLDNLPFLKYIAKKGKPIILSTGMGTLGEVEEAIGIIRANSNEKIIVMHCVSAYPPKYEEINLNAISTLERSFGLPVGFSDHTIGITIPLAALAMGAKMIEKHYTLDKQMEGPDHAVSSDPEELKNLVLGIRAIEKAFGTGFKGPSTTEKEMKSAFRRSMVANTDIKEGTVFTEDIISFKRPGTGISPKYLDFIVGKKAKRNIKYDDLIRMDDF